MCEGPAWGRPGCMLSLPATLPGPFALPCASAPGLFSGKASASGTRFCAQGFVGSQAPETLSPSWVGGAVGEWGAVAGSSAVTRPGLVGVRSSWVCCFPGPCPGQQGSSVG